MVRYEPIGSISEQEAKDWAARLFPEKADLYAVMDFAVCFGFYEKGLFWGGLTGHDLPKMLDWRYLQELRIFDEEQELLLVPSEAGWTGRIRRDAGADGGDGRIHEYVIDEHQKLWGRVRWAGKMGEKDWSLLSSGRGTEILIPCKMGIQEEAAIQVRRYMRIPDVEKGEELVYQNDIRMVRVCPWKGDGGDGGQV